MSDSLATRLAERLDIQPEQTDRLIRTLAKLIQTQASRDGSVQVPSLGVFRQSDEGLVFEPDVRFAEAVNPRYAHLETLSLAALTEQGASYFQEEEPETSEAGGDAHPAMEHDEVPLAPTLSPLETDDLPGDGDETVQWRPEEVESALKSAEIEPDAEIAEQPTEEASDDEFVEEEIAEDETRTWAFSAIAAAIPEPEVHATADALLADEDLFADDAHAEEDIVAEEPFHPHVDALAARLLAALPDDTSEVEIADSTDIEMESTASSVDTDPDEPVAVISEDTVDEAAIDDEDFEDPDLSEAAAYESLQEESALFEEDTFLEEEEPSAWAPPGTRWSGENQDQLEPIDAEAGAQEADNPPMALPSMDEVEPEVEPEKAAFAPPGLVAEREAIPDVDRSARKTALPQHTPASRYQEQSDNQSSQRSVWSWLLAALVFVVIAGGVYYYFNLREQPIAANDVPPIATMPETPEEPAVEELAATTGESDTPADPATAETVTTQDPATSPDETTPPPEPPPVQAGSINLSEGGYTLIVGSRGSRANAEADAERIRQALSEASLPVDVLEGTSNGITRYRIGVGQVESVDAAVALKQRLGNRITADAWVTAISSDN